MDKIGNLVIVFEKSSSLNIDAQGYYGFTFTYFCDNGIDIYILFCGLVFDYDSLKTRAF